jgi:hypothetical protein
MSSEVVTVLIEKFLDSPDQFLRLTASRYYYGHLFKVSMPQCEKDIITNFVEAVEDHYDRLHRIQSGANFDLVCPCYHGSDHQYLNLVFQVAHQCTRIRAGNDPPLCDTLPLELWSIILGLIWDDSSQECSRTCRTILKVLKTKYLRSLLLDFIYREIEATDVSTYDWVLHYAMNNELASRIRILRISLPGFDREDETSCDNLYPRTSSLKCATSTTLELQPISEDLCLLGLQKKLQVSLRSLKLGYHFAIDSCDRDLGLLPKMISLVNPGLSGLDLGKCHLSIACLRKIMILGGRDFTGINMIETEIELLGEDERELDSNLELIPNPEGPEEEGMENTTKVWVQELLIGTSLLSTLLENFWVFKGLVRLEIMLDNIEVESDSESELNDLNAQADGTSSSNHRSPHQWLDLASNINETLKINFLREVVVLPHAGDGLPSQFLCRTLELQVVNSDWSDGLKRLFLFLFSVQSFPNLEQLAVILPEYPHGPCILGGFRKMDLIWKALFSKSQERFPALQRITLYLPHVCENIPTWTHTMEQLLWEYFVQEIDVNAIVEIEYLEIDYRFVDMILNIQ